MSNIRKALESENVSEDKIQKVLKELGIKDSKRWAPKIGEDYWTVYRDSTHRYDWEGNKIDLHLKLTGNMFRTEQEAQHHRDKLIFLAKMKIDFEDNSDEIDWGSMKQYKFSIFLDGRYDSIKAQHNSFAQIPGAIYTTNKEWLKQYIIDNEQQIKKYCFGIE